MKNRILEVIIALFLFSAMSNVTFAADYNETYCRSCHGTTVDRHHLLAASGTYQCMDCHATKHDSQNQTYYTEVIRNCVTCHVATQHTCMSCHPEVNSSDLGLHSSMNGSSAVDNGDCTTCHFNSFPMVKGAVNNSNTYFCADCHTPGSTNPKKSTSRIFTEKKHGQAACMDCHVADGIYHKDNPRGSVANSTYVNRYPTTNTNTTDCADCHRAANLDDAPFYAPGGGSHIGESCSGGGCHGPSGSVVQVVHKVNPLDSATKKPYISTPALDHSTVTQGTDVNITATVNFTLNYGNALVDGAQYRINNSDNTRTILSWTSMIAADGNFNSILEVAKGRINTNNLSGIYNIEVRGMGGGPSQNPLERYYPMNGDVSTTKVVILTVQRGMEYINGTVTSGGLALPGAYVSTDGANDTSKYDGSYSLRVTNGTYSVTASKQPTHYDNTIVASSNTTSANIGLEEKPKGTISGTVTNA